MALKQAVQARTPEESGLVSIPIGSFFHHSQRAAKLGAPKVADLFAGAGGFSLGFEFAGANIVSAIEKDEWACDTLRHNHPHTSVHSSDIQALSDDELGRLVGNVDILIGGPPCQGFSVANIRAGDPNDPRNSLFREFIRAAEIANPRALLLENVPGLLRRQTADGRAVISVITSEFSRLGYQPYFSILQAMDFGVPQLRPRLFVLGLRRKSQNPFPRPTHGEDAQQEAPSLFNSLSGKKRLVTVWDAISDLPTIEAREGADEMGYSSEPANDYQYMMRANSPKVYNHTAMRHSRRLVERFAQVKWGESSADAPSEHGARRRGTPTEISKKGYDQNNRRMYPDRPCHTIPASFYANFIHPFSNRNFTPREGARMQSFPDWYRFLGKPTVVSHRLLGREGRHDELHLCQYNQIGNAVPPLLAFHLAQHVIELI